MLAISFAAMIGATFAPIGDANAETIEANEPEALVAEVSELVTPAIDMNSLTAMLDEKAQQAHQASRTNSFIDKALSLVGTPYVYGGRTPNGFDCSGFVGYCASEALGMDLPRSSAAQSSVGVDVSFDELQAGDLLFWGSRRGVYHVGIYIGDGKYVHSESTGTGVCVRDFSYYGPSFAKRIL